MHTQSEENYLKTIYHLQMQHDTVATNAVAQALATSAASVTDMMKKLHAKGLLHYKKYHGFSLSAEGRKAALFIIRRHRLWEAFLAQKLQFAWDEVHEIAEELEHISHKKLIERLDAFLGYPQFDPHGDPIPDGKGRLQHSDARKLSEVAVPFAGTISMVALQTKALLEELAARQLQVGTAIEVQSRSKFDGSLTLKVRKKEILITEEMASHLLVKKR